MISAITGANGFIGSHLVEHILGRGHVVRCLVRKTSDLRWLKGLNVEYIEGDLSSEDALARLVTGADYVFHNAGLTKAKTKEEYFQANTTGTENVLAATVKHNPTVRRFVHVSSGTAAGPSPTPTPITEEAEPHPITTYGRSKLAAEQAVLRAANTIPVTICRPPAVYGPRDKDVFEFFKTLDGGLQPMVGFNSKLVSMVHAGDLVRGMVMAAESPVAAGKVYFISSAVVYDWKQLGIITRSALGKYALPVRVPEFGVYAIAAVAEFLSLFSSAPALINFEKARDMVQDYWTSDSSRAKVDFGYEQRISAEDGIRETFAFARSMGWLKPAR